MKKIIKTEKGFTLLEVLTAFLVLSFSLLLLLNMAMVALEGNSWASGTTSATQLIQEKLEQLRTDANPVSGSDSVPVLSVNDTLGYVYRSWRVTTAAPHLRLVDIRTVWITPDSIAHRNAITTLVKSDAA